MNLMQSQVELFMKMCKQLPQEGARPGSFDTKELSIKLIKEESRELCAALHNENLVEAVDGICDLLYVTFGAAVRLGINIQPFFELVHRANLKKLDGPVRADGKQLKPPGWQAPNDQMKRMLTQYMVRGAVAEEEFEQEEEHDEPEPLRSHDV